MASPSQGAFLNQHRPREQVTVRKKLISQSSRSAKPGEPLLGGPPSFSHDASDHGALYYVSMLQHARRASKPSQCPEENRSDTGVKDSHSSASSNPGVKEQSRSRPKGFPSLPHSEILLRPRVSIESHLSTKHLKPLISWDMLQDIASYRNRGLGLGKGRIRHPLALTYLVAGRAQQ